MCHDYKRLHWLRNTTSVIWFVDYGTFLTTVALKKRTFPIIPRAFSRHILSCFFEHNTCPIKAEWIYPKTSLHLLFIQKIIRQIEHRLHRYPSIYLLAYQALLPQFTLLEIEHVIRIEMHAVNSHLKMQMSRCRPPCPSC